MKLNSRKTVLAVGTAIACALATITPASAEQTPTAKAQTACKEAFDQYRKEQSAKKNADEAKAAAEKNVDSDSTKIYNKGKDAFESAEANNDKSFQSLAATLKKVFLDGDADTQTVNEAMKSFKRTPEMCLTDMTTEDASVLNKAQIAFIKAKGDLGDATLSYNTATENFKKVKADSSTNGKVPSGFFKCNGALHDETSGQPKNAAEADKAKQKIQETQGSSQVMDVVHDDKAGKWVCQTKSQHTITVLQKVAAIITAIVGVFTAFFAISKALPSELTGGLKALSGLGSLGSLLGAVGGA